MRLPRALAALIVALVLLCGYALSVIFGRSERGPAEKSATVTVTSPAPQTMSAGLAQDNQAEAGVSGRAKLPDTHPTPSAAKLQAYRLIGTNSKQEINAPAPFDEPMEAMRFYVQKRARPGESFVPSAQYVIARRRMTAMPRHVTQSTAVRVDSSLHPLSATLGTAVQLGPGNIGGRTRSLIIHPANPNIMYAGAVAGGIWKTIDAGASWQPIADSLSNLAVSTLAMAPTDRNTIYAGTGEGYFNWDAVRGDGIFKTTDGGATWAQLPSTHSTADFYYVNRVLVSPLTSSRVYAATNTGVFRSTDGGASWLKILDAADGCQDLAIRTDQPTDYVFVTCGQFSRATIYRSPAAESTTLPVFSAVYSETYMGRTSLAIAPSNQNVIYAMSASIDSAIPYYLGLHAVFRSVNSGSTWTAQVRNTNSTLLNTLLLSNPYIGVCQNRAANQGWYDNVIAVDPVDPNRVWAGGIDLFRSDDAGATWGLASYWWANTASPEYSHADHHAIVFHPQYDGLSNRVMFDANDGGLFQLADAWAATSTSGCTVSGAASWTTLNHQYSTAQFYFGQPYPGATSYFGGTQDNGTLRGDDTSGAQAWSRIYGGDGGFVAIDPTNTNTIYSETPYLNIIKSENGGQSFGGFPYLPGGYFIAPFAIDPSDPTLVWAGGDKVYRVTTGSNFIASGSYVALDMSGTSGSISALAVEPGNNNHVIAGKGSGWIYNIHDSFAGPVSQYSMALPRSGWVSSLVFDPTNPQIVYATYSSFGGNHVFKSPNGGSGWFAIDGSGNTQLPDVPVNSLVVDMYNPGTLYVATDVGIFTSLDGGGSASTASWAVESTGIPAVPIESITVESSTNTLFAFSHGRGVWRLPLTASGSNPIPKVGRLMPSAIAAGSVDFTLLVGGTAFVPGSVVRWNGSDRPTTYFSPSLLQASIAASDVAANGTSSVTVRSPSPGGGTSNSVSFQIVTGTADLLVSPTDWVSTYSMGMVGYVNTNGSAMTAYFRYSTSSDFSNSAITTPVLIPNMNGGGYVRISPIAGGLNPSTTYYYRLEVTPSLYTATSTATTAAVPVLSAINNLYAGSDSAGVFFNVTWSGAQAANMWGWIEASTDANFSSPLRAPRFMYTISNDGQVSSGLSGALVPNTTYYCRGAVNLENSYTGAHVQFTQPVNCATPSISATTAAVTSLSGTSVTLNGVFNSGGGQQITGWFRWGVSPTLAAGATTPTQTFYNNFSAENRSQALSGLVPGATYYYRAEIASPNGGSQVGTILSFTTPGSQKKRRGQIISQ